MRKFISAFFLLVLVLGIVLKLKLFLGIAPSLVLALLVVFGLVLNFYETVFLAAFAAWILNWQPYPGPELWVLFGVAMLSYFGRYFMPWQRWMSLIILTVGGIFLLYAAGAHSIVGSNIAFLLTDSAISVAFAFIVLRTFRFFYGKASS